MGLGALLRNLVYTGTDTQTGQSETWTVVTDSGPGMYADWSHGRYEGGMAIPGAWRAALLLSDLLGAIPWHAYRDEPDGVAVRMPTPLLLQQPAPPDNRMTTFSSWGLDLLWHGNAVGLIVARGDRGEPTALLPIPARAVGVDRVGRGAGTPDFPVGTVMYWIGGQWRSAADVVHVKGPCAPGELRGMGVLENHQRGTLTLAVEQARQAGNLTVSGVPTGTLKSQNPDLTQGEADDLKAGWLKAQRDRTVAVLNATTEFQALAWDPTETQLLDARRYSLHEIALIFGLDPSWLGAAQTSRVYSNIEQEAINLAKFSLGGHLARFEHALSAVMPPGERAAANLDALLRADTLTRYRAHRTGIAAQFLTVDEARAMENRPPLTDQQIARMERLAALDGPVDEPDQEPAEPEEQGD